MTERPYDIEITHVVDAPPERVYQAFTDPDQFARWYGRPGSRSTATPSRSTPGSGDGIGSTWWGDLGRQAWEMMLPKLESLLSG